MRAKKYKRVATEEKIRIVSLVIAGESVTEVAKKARVPRSTLVMWIADERINPDKEYALRYRKEHPWMGKTKKKGFKEADPSPEGVKETTSSNPEELKKENKDLRRKIAYLEDKVLYLETLYELISESPDEVSKKKDFKQS